VRCRSARLNFELCHFHLYSCKFSPYTCCYGYDVFALLDLLPRVRCKIDEPDARLGQLKTVLSTFFGLFAFGGVDMRFLNLLGLCVNTLGGLLYAWFKYLEQQKKDHSDKEIP